jgi:hypothetical protein
MDQAHRSFHTQTGALRHPDTYIIAGPQILSGFTAGLMVRIRLAVVPVYEHMYTPDCGLACRQRRPGNLQMLYPKYH